MRKMQKGELLLNEFTIVKEIGAGSFGTIYKAKYEGKFVALKMEKNDSSSTAKNERGVYAFMQKRLPNDIIPQLYKIVKTTEFSALCMELLGPSLDEIFTKCGYKFTVTTVLAIGLRTLDLIEKLHQVGIIHRDIKPSNFLIGVGAKKQTIYVADFGLSKPYSRAGRHVSFEIGKSFVGTARYASTNVHLGIKHSRRDDLESIGYMLLHFVNGTLPWQGMKKAHGMSRCETIRDAKLSTDLDRLCDGLPDCFVGYMTYCKNLKFAETPDYLYLRSLFGDTLNNLGGNSLSQIIP